MELKVRYGKGVLPLLPTKRGTVEIVALEPWKFKKSKISSYINQHDGEWFLQAADYTTVTFRTGVYVTGEKEYNICVVTNAGIYYITNTGEEEILLKHIMRPGDAITEGAILGTIILTKKNITIKERND
jgi:hypothetical protein